jgi:hypothetical protein
MGLAWFTYALMLIGTLMAAYHVRQLVERALHHVRAAQGQRLVYLGITLVVVASILPLFVVLEMRRAGSVPIPGSSPRW